MATRVEELRSDVIHLVQIHKTTHGDTDLLAACALLLEVAQ